MASSVTGSVISIRNHLATQKEFESITDEHVHSIMGRYGTIFREGIYRWKSKGGGKKPLHLFIEFGSSESAQAASRHTGNEKWIVTHIHRDKILLKEHLKMKAQPGFAHWGPNAQSQQPLFSKTLLNMEAFPPPYSTCSKTSCPSAIPSMPGGIADQHGVESWPASSQSTSGVLVNPPQPIHSHWVPLLDPSSATLVAAMAPNQPDSYLRRRSRDPEQDDQLSPLCKRQRSVGPSQMESAQERLEDSELESRAQDADAKSRAAEEHAARLERVKGENRTLVAEQATRDEERYTQLAMQLGQALARERELRESQERMASAREAELKLKCEMLEEQLEQVLRNQLETSKEKE